METAWGIYWITRLISLKGFAVFLTMGSIVSFGMAWFIYVMSLDGYGLPESMMKKVPSFTKRVAIFGLGAAFITLMIPSREDFILMFGGQAAMDIANNEQVSGVVKDALGLLQDEISEARESKIKKEEKDAK